MNRRPQIAVLAVAALFASTLFSGVASAQIPAAVRTSPTPSGSRDVITAFIKANLDKAKGTDAKAAREGRDLLIGELSAPNAGGPYKDVYGQALSGELVAMLGESDLHARVVAALIGGRAAQLLSHDNAQLAPAIAKAMSDKNAAVALHGVKGAKGVLAYQASQGGGAKSDLYAAIGTAVSTHPANGEIAKDASEAMGLSDLMVLAKLPTATAAQITPTAMRILDTRGELFKKGLPDQWDTDRDFVNFFTSTNANFRALGAERQADVFQRSLDMLYSHTAAATADVANSHVVLVDTVDLGRSIYSLLVLLDEAKVEGASAAVAAAAPMKSWSRNSPPQAADIEATADKVIEAMKGIKGFGSIARPEITVDAKPTTQPGK